MLDACTHVFALYAFDQGCCHLSRQIGILGKILEIPAAQRAALDIDRRPQQDAQFLMLAAFTQCFAHFLHQFRIEGSRRSAGCRIADRLDAVIDPQMIAFLILLAQTVRPVGNHCGGNTQAFHCFGMPEIRAGAEPGLFLQGHFGNQFLYRFFIHMSPRQYCQVLSFVSSSTVLRSQGS